MDEKLVQVVDEQDTPLGGASKAEIWRDGLLHRIVRVMVVNNEGRLLLQRRAPHKLPFPDRWDVSTGGHVDEGEDYEEAALRELSEENGITGANLVYLGDFRSDSQYEWRKLRRFNRVYKVEVDTPVSLVPGDEDIAELRWMSIDEAREMVTTHPESVTDGLKVILERYFK